MRVLILEDDPLIAADLSQTVQDLGHELCGCASTADQARVLAEAQRPDVLFVDFNLQGATTGLSAAAQITEQMPAKVVFVTGQYDPLVHEALADFRPLAVLGKPYTPQQIRAALDQA